jgi:hypothetical protein
MHRRVIFLPAAMLAMFNSYAQQPPQTRYTFKTLAFSDPHDKDATIEGAALSDDGETVAFVVRWTEANVEHTGLFTPSKMIARDGSKIEGRTIKRILPTSLTINRAGVIGYEASCGNANQIAVFVGNKFGAALSKGGEANDFTLADDGQVILVGATIAASDQTKMTNDANRSASVRAIPGTVYDRFRRIVPAIPLPPGGVLSGPPSTEKRAVQGRSASDRPCKAPEYPYPYEWNIGTSVIGPIASHFSEAPAASHTFDSPFFGRIATPFREIQCSAAGTPLVIVIGDARQHLYEIYTGNGLLTRTRSDGYLDLPGVTGNVLAGQIIRGDTSIRINKTGQILLPILLILPAPRSCSRHRNIRRTIRRACFLDEPRAYYKSENLCQDMTTYSTVLCYRCPMRTTWTSGPSARAV